MNLLHSRTAAASMLAGAGLMLAACSSNATTAANSAPAPGPHSGTGTSAASTQTSASGTTAKASHPAAAGGSACSLVTESDVSTTVGSDPGKGSAFTSHGASQCQYGSYKTQVVIVNVVPSRGEILYAHLFKDPRSHAVAVAGVGDKALEHTDTHSDSIYFIKHDALVFVGITTQTTPPKGGALALARIAADRF